MTIRTVTPAGGAATLSIAWDNGQVQLLAGQVLDVPAGGPLEAAIGLANLTPLAGLQQADDQQGDGSTGTGNS